MSETTQMEALALQSHDSFSEDDGVTWRTAKRVTVRGSRGVFDKVVVVDELGKSHFFSPDSVLLVR